MSKRVASAGSAVAPELRLDRATISRAEELAAEYTILIEPSPVESGKGWYLARALELPTAFANGRSPAEAFDKLREALLTIVGTMLSEGVQPPAPSGMIKREHQMNIRLSALEKAKLESAARGAGFRSISDFVRTVALSRAS